MLRRPLVARAPLSRSVARTTMRQPSAALRDVGIVPMTTYISLDMHGGNFAVDTIVFQPPPT